MDAGTIRLGDPVGTGVGPAEVEFVSGKLTVVPLTYVADIVTVLAQQSRVGLIPGCVKSLECSVAMTGHPLASEKARSANPADRGGHTGAGESYTVSRQLIQMRRLNNSVAGNA